MKHTPNPEWRSAPYEAYGRATAQGVQKAIELALKSRRNKKNHLVVSVRGGRGKLFTWAIWEIHKKWNE